MAGQEFGDSSCSSMIRSIVTPRYSASPFTHFMQLSQIFSGSRSHRSHSPQPMHSLSYNTQGRCFSIYYSSCCTDYTTCRKGRSSLDGLELRTFTEEEYHAFFMKYVPDPIMDPSPFRYSRSLTSSFCKMIPNSQECICRSIRFNWSDPTGIRSRKTPK